MSGVIFNQMAPLMGVVFAGLVYFGIGLYQYPKFSKPQRVVFQIGLVCYLLGLCLFVATTLLKLAGCQDVRVYI